MTKDGTTNTPIASTTAIGAVIDQIHDHRFGADELPTLVFCEHTPAVVDVAVVTSRIDAD